MHDADKEILADFKRARDKTIELLERVPAQMLTKTAKGEDASLGELFKHIAIVVDGWMFRLMKDGGPGPNRELKPTRANLLKALRASQKRLPKHFQAKNGAALNTKYSGEWQGKKYTFTGRNRVLYLTHHEVHHRGKIVLALRQWGFTDVPFLPF